MPVFVENRRVPEDERLQASLRVVDGELDGFAPRVEGDRHLGAALRVGDADHVPRALGQLPRPEGADERELLRQAQREDVPRGDGEVGAPVEAVGGLHAVGAAHARHAGELRLEHVQPEAADEVERLQVVLARLEVRARQPQLLLLLQQL